MSRRVEYYTYCYLELLTLTSPIFSAFRIDWPVLWPPVTYSVSLLHCFHWLPVKFRADFKICLLTYKCLCEKQPGFLHSTLSPFLPSCSLRSKKSPCRSIESRPMQMQGHFNLALFSFGTTSCYIYVQHLNFNPQEKSQNISLRLGLSPIEISAPYGPLMLCSLCWCYAHYVDVMLIDFHFAGEQWRCWRVAVHQQNARGVGAIKIWLIDWFLGRGDVWRDWPRISVCRTADRSASVRRRTQIDPSIGTVWDVWVLTGRGIRAWGCHHFHLRWSRLLRQKR